MTHNTPPHTPPAARQSALGLPVIALVGLAAIAVPRAILHDLHLISESGLLTWILALGPVAVWIAVAVMKRVPKPFLTVLVIGIFYGIMLVITHQLLWDYAYEGDPPTIGGGSMATAIPRLAAIPSGLFVGALVGAIGGLIAWGIRAAVTRKAPRA
ncbi:MAG: hypothetical protein K0Q52_2464 [Microbacterium sp.]|jgi:hypothetical protein|nr:hypothetical protein [Microbacterium sp.]